MSTKIYEAYRVKSAQLPKILMKIRVKANQMKADSLKKIAELIAKKGIDIEEEAFLLKHMKDHRYTGYSLCLTLGMYIAPMKDGWTYIKLYGDYSNIVEITKTIKTLKEIKDYHYQNQTDGPENINEKNFALRGKKWDEITGGVSYSTMLDIVLIPDFIISENTYELQEEIRKERAKLLI